MVLSPSGWTHSGRPRDHRHRAPCSRNGRPRASEPASVARGSIPCPEDVTKCNDRRPTPGSEAQPHPRTGQGRLHRLCGKTWNPGVVRGQALFLNLFPCEAGATWFSANDGRVHLLPDLNLISGPPLIAARRPAAFPPGSAQSAEPDPLPSLCLWL